MRSVRLRYLLVTHIPFARQGGAAVLDKLWAEDIRGTVGSVGPITIAAPELARAEEIQAWGSTTDTLSKTDGVEFVGLPVHGGRKDVLFERKVRAVLGPAVKLGKKTLFVVAEDFYDMFSWEWVRTQTNPLKRWRTQRMLDGLDRGVKERVGNASLCFLHTPAAAARYRQYAANAMHIRQPVHETQDVVSTAELEARSAELRSGVPLRIVTASRMESLKGIDFLLRAVAILNQRKVAVTATLYGGGKRLDEYKALAERLGVGDRVEFPGSVASGPALREALAKGHLFLMPHLTTDFGRAFFDAMAAGLPVIAFRSVASQDTVRHRVDGLITPNADAEGLADGIGQFDRDREFLVGATAAARERGLVNTKSVWNGLRTERILELFL